MSIRIVVADDHQVVREGLRGLLEALEGVEVVGETADGRETVEVAVRLKPDLVLMDVNMKGLNGVQATQQICSHCPEVRVVGLSQHADKRTVASMFQAGASGFVRKGDAFDEVRRAVLDVAAGRFYVSPALTGSLIADYIQHLTQGPEDGVKLTDRELEVLQLLVEGVSAQDIARTLHISANTVNTHRQHIMEKLGVKSLPELTKYALREGITYLDN